MATRSLTRMGLDSALVHRLATRNIHTAQDLLGKTELDLMEVVDLTLPVVQAAIRQVSAKVCPAATSLLELVQSRQQARTHLPTFLPTLDRALRGGVSGSAITELVGPAGVGKTQLCLMLSVVACMPTAFEGAGGGVVYVDTESRFSSARLVEIATGHFPQCYNSAAAVDELMNKIIVVSPHTSHELLERLDGMESMIISQKVQLLVIDSVAALPRAEFDNTQTIQRQEILGKQAARLKYIAESFHIPVVVTNQVTTSLRNTTDTPQFAFAQQAHLPRINQDIRAESQLVAALGTKWAHCVNTRLVLEKAAGQRIMSVVKSPAAPHIAVAYEVTANGVEELGPSQHEDPAPNARGDAHSMPIRNTEGFRYNQQI